MKLLVRWTLWLQTVGRTGRQYCAILATERERNTFSVVIILNWHTLTLRPTARHNTAHAHWEISLTGQQHQVARDWCGFTLVISLTFLTPQPFSCFGNISLVLVHILEWSHCSMLRYVGSRGRRSHEEASKATLSWRWRTSPLPFYRNTSTICLR